MEEPSRPAPRWVFLLRNRLVLAAFVIAVLLGGISVSVILFAIQQTDFNLTTHMSHSALEMLLGLLPFIWIVLVILALVLSMYAVLYSQRGYKYTLVRLLLDSAALSVLLGTLFFIAGGAQKLEHAFAVNVSIYESIQEKKVVLWTRPEEGFLSGEILDANATTIRLKDFNHTEWRIDYDEAFTHSSVLLEPGEKIKVIGTIKSSGQFAAQEIRPWGGHGQNFGRGKGRGQ
jgi:hypothetical protein